ncbi:MAG: hypothetical protein V7782_10005 [Psychromonas sp.]
MNTTVSLNIYSPRWGHEDAYYAELHADFMEISMGPHKARVTWTEHGEPQWQGESIHAIMNNDKVYPPANIAGLFEHVWKEWLAEKITIEQVGEELQHLAAWINASTKAKPSSKFWEMYF